MVRRGLFAASVLVLGGAGAERLLSQPKLQLPPRVEQACEQEIRRAVERCYEDPAQFNQEDRTGEPSAAQELRACLGQQQRWEFIMNCSRPDPYTGGHFYVGGRGGENTWLSPSDDDKLQM